MAQLQSESKQDTSSTKTSNKPPHDPVLLSGKRLTAFEDLDGSGKPDLYRLTGKLPSGDSALGPVVSAKKFVQQNFGKGDLDTYLFFDPGTDDFPAGLYALLKKERFNLLSVVVTFGNVGFTQVRRNAELLAALAAQHPGTDFAKFRGVFEGSRSPIDGKEREDAAGEHGPDGLGGSKVNYNAEKTHELREKYRARPNGVEMVADDIIGRYRAKKRNPGSAPEKVVLTAVGPLTDLYKTLASVKDREPEALSMVRGISIMGGGIDIGTEKNRWHTNVTDFAEFNFAQDPNAAHRLFSLLAQSGERIPVVIIPLDVTHTTSVSGDVQGKYLKDRAREFAAKVRTKDAAPLVDFAGQLLSAIGSYDVDRSLNLYKYDRPRRFMHDPNAFTVLSRPELYDVVAVDVEVTPEPSPEAGRLRVKASPNSPIVIAVRADASKVSDEWLTTFGKRP